MLSLSLDGPEESLTTQLYDTRSLFYKSPLRTLELQFKSVNHILVFILCVSLTN